MGWIFNDRDISLFKFYNIPQKTRYSHVAHNVSFYISFQVFCHPTHRCKSSEVEFIALAEPMYHDETVGLVTSKYRSNDY